MIDRQSDEFFDTIYEDVRIFLSVKFAISLLVLLAEGLSNVVFKPFDGGKECCVFQPAFGCAQHPKAGQNTQQRGLT